LNDREFIISLQNGDQHAFRLLVETWQHMVYNTVLSIVQDVQEAEDVAQEVFIQVYQSVKGFRGDAKLSTWIYRVAVTKALDAERKKKSKKRVANLRMWIGFGGKEEEEPVQFHHPGVALDNKERAAVLFKAMQKLPENQRIAFTLIKAEGLSYEETAAIMNISIKAVEALMHRAKENLKKYLQPYYSEE
jgi:RNA polymerase sigma factor (sigma-70 family)